MMAYQYYPNNQFYINDLQQMKDKIENQIKQYQQNMQQQPVPITQNFQITPQNNMNNALESKYVENIDDVKNTFVMKTGVFVNKDFSSLWIKDYTGKIRTFVTEEIVELDEKDKEIYKLKKEIEEMKGMIINAKSDNTNVDEQITTKKSTRTSSNTKSNEK